MQQNEYFSLVIRSIVRSVGTARRARVCEPRQILETRSCFSSERQRDEKVSMLAEYLESSFFLSRRSQRAREKERGGGGGGWRGRKGKRWVAVRR